MYTAVPQSDRVARQKRKHRAPQKGGVSVIKIRERVLSLSEAERYIRAFEEKYGFSSDELFRDSAARNKLPEDDAFKWAAFLDLKKEIEAFQEELHVEYLADLELADPGVPQPREFPGRTLSRLMLAWRGLPRI